MPYLRSMRPRKSSTSTRRRRRATSKRVPLATKRYIRKIMPKPEIKQMWTHVNENALNTLSQGFFDYMPAIATGVSSIGRIGNTVKLNGIHLRGALNNNSGSESYARCVVIQYDGRQDPAVGFFRNAQSNTCAAISSINGLDAIYYPVNKMDFIVRWDKVFKLGGSTSNSSATCTRLFSKFIKFNKIINYHSAATGIAGQDWMYAVIWIAADANDDTTTGTTVEVSYLHRMYFSDP